MAAVGVSRILRLGSLRRSRFRSSFDSPAAAGIHAFRFSSRESVAVPEDPSANPALTEQPDSLVLAA
jgi:hypothetical protein